MLLKRGDVVIANLVNKIGSEQAGLRLGVIVSNDKCNLNSPTVHFVPITSKKKRILPTHVNIYHSDYPFVYHDSTVICEQLTLIDKRRIFSKLGSVDVNTLSLIDKALCVQLELTPKQIAESRY